eukprot:m.17679 g.17679  ORF g.17679 m.17679 type:complete len:172 (+) comp11276_c0_seq3:112-627(+)
MIDTERLATVGIKWAAIAVFGAGATWWVSRCIQSTVKEVREITSDVKDSIIVVQNLVQLPHLVKAIEFSTIPMDDPTWQWGRMYDMGRDFRAIAETARSIAESTALERGLGIAEKSIDHQLALDAAAADGSSGVQCADSVRLPVCARFPVRATWDCLYQGIVCGRFTTSAP